MSFGLAVALFFQSWTLEPFANLVLYSAYRIIYHLVCHLGINLSRGRIFVSQHFWHCFQRNAVHQGDRRCKGMSRHVEFQILGNSALSGDMFQAGIRRFQRRHRKDLSRILGKQRVMPILLYSVLFKDCLCDRKQFYRERDFRLLTGTANPPCSVRSLCLSFLR